MPTQNDDPIITGVNPDVVGTVYAIPTSEIYPMPDSPYSVQDDAAMAELMDSIKQFGILVPTEVRPKEGGGYEMISGSRRTHAAKLAGLDRVPAVILNLDDDDAIIRLIDTNIQRENIPPSEKAKAYKMKMEALRRKAGRPSKAQDIMPSENGGQVGHHFQPVKTRDLIAESSDDSARTIQRYIRLTELSPELQTMVDDKKIGMTPAVEISYLTPQEQSLLVSTIDSEQNTPSLSQAQRMRKLSQAGGLNEDTMLEIMMEQKKPVKNDITLSGEKLRKYFPKSYSPIQMEAVIFKLLEAWHQKRQRSQSR